METHYLRHTTVKLGPLSGYNTGDVVMHDIFGKGIIIGLEDNVGTIFFDKEKSLKKIMLSAPTLHKFK